MGTPYSVRPASGSDNIVILDLIGRVADGSGNPPGPGVIDKVVDDLSSGRMSLSPQVSVGLADLIDAQIGLGKKFIVVNCSRLTALDLTCSMAIAAHAPRLWAAGGAIVLCACPSSEQWAVAKLPCSHVLTEAEALNLCVPDPGAPGVLWPAALDVEVMMANGTAVLAMTGGYWGESAYEKLASTVRGISSDKMVFLARDLTAFSPDGVGPYIQLLKGLKERGVRVCWSELTELPLTLLSGIGLIGLIPHFPRVQDAAVAMDALKPGQTLSALEPNKKGCGSSAAMLALLPLIGYLMY